MAVPALGELGRGRAVSGFPESAVELVRAHSEADRPVRRVFESAGLGGLSVEVREVRKEPLKMLLEVIVSNVLLRRIAFQAYGLQRVVVCRQLAQALCRRDFVETQVEDRQLQQPVETLHLADLVPGYVQLLQSRTRC